MVENNFSPGTIGFRDCFCIAAMLVLVYINPTWGMSDSIGKSLASWPQMIYSELP